MNILQKIEKLEEKIKELRIIDSEDIIAEDTGLGIVLHLEDPSIDSEEEEEDYKGGFKVIKTTIDGVLSLKVIYGNLPDYENCGEIDVPNPDGDGYLKCPVISFPLTDDSVYISLVLIYNLETEKYEATITYKTDGWDYPPGIWSNPPSNNPGLLIKLAYYSANNGIDQKLIITGGYNSQLRLELQGKYWI